MGKDAGSRGTRDAALLESDEDMEPAKAGRARENVKNIDMLAAKGALQAVREIRMHVLEL